jgi:phage tail-like protein
VTTGKTLYLVPASFFVLKVPDIDTIGAFTHCTGLEVEFDVLQYHEGGNNEFVHHLPGHMKHPNLVFTRGLTNQDNFHKWLWKTKTEPELKEITLQFLDHTKKVQRTWTFGDAFPVKWTGPEFDADSHQIAVERLEVAHSGLKGV